MCAAAFKARAGHLNRTAIGIGSYCYPFAVGGVPSRMPAHPLGPLELVEKALSLGVGVVQLSDNMKPHLWPEEVADELASRAQESGVTLELGLRGMTPEHLRRYIPLCKRVGAGLLRCVVDGPDFAPGLPDIARILTDVLPQLHENGLVLALETHDRFTAREMAGLMRQVGDGRVGVALDAANCIPQEERALEVAERLAPYTLNFHAKDFRFRRRTDAMGLVVAGTPAGQGRLPVAAIWEILAREAPGDFSTTLEFWMEPAGTVEETLEKEEGCVRESVAYLKGLLSTCGMA